MMNSTHVTLSTPYTPAAHLAAESLNEEPGLETLTDVRTELSPSEGVELDVPTAPTELAFQSTTNAKHRSGFVALVGRPNVGKSTLLNQLLGERIAICSPVMQTTRHRIRGIATRENAQLIMLDTPGFSKPIDKLGEFLVEEGHAALSEADVLACVMDITSEPGRGDAWVIEQACNTGRPVFLILNKVDRLRQNVELQRVRTQAYVSLFEARGVKPARILHTSAKTGRQKEVVLDALFHALPLGPAYYEADTLTDQRLREMVAELIREQVLLNTQDELPHSVAIGIDEFDESDEAITHIYATVYVNKKSQQGMVVGKNGAMIKRIGEGARKRAEHLLDRKVYLRLDVKTKNNWRKDDAFLKRINLALPG
jgi:GTPase